MLSNRFRVGGGRISAAARRTAIVLAALSVLAAGSATIPARANPDCTFDWRHPALGLGSGGRYESPPPTETWQGTAWQSQVAAMPSAATGAQLCGTLFAPDPLPSGPVPAVVIVTASGPSVQTQYHWSARELANNGYVVLALDVQGQGKSETFKPSGNSAPVGQAMCNWTQVPTPENPYICPGVPWQQVDNYIDAVVSGINFMTSTSNPWLSSVDTTRIGAAGHSMGARAVSYAQGIDNRIDAIVAWDNLASTTEGDNGSSSGGPPVGTLLGGEIPGTARIATPRVPAMGQASEYGSALRAGPPIVVDEPRIDANPEWKKTAYQTWRRAGVESMELAFNDSVHGSWAQGPWSAAQPGWGPMARNFQYYTRAWFDRWLKGDTAATSRLLATTINGSSRSDVLSDVYYSAAYFDGNDCADLSAC